MAKDSFYFKHDYNARTDPKMAKLIRVAGWEGYGLAWALIEMIYEQGGRISHDPEDIAYQLRADQTRVESVIASGVFFIEDGMVGSERVDRALDERRALAEAGRGAVSRRTRPDGTAWVKDRGLLGTYPVPNTRRGEERREEDITAARPSPSAADLSINGAIEASERRMMELGLANARLPFAFGDAARGTPLQDLSDDTCRAIIDRMPRIGGEFGKLLKYRIAQKAAEGIRPRRST